MMSDGSEFDCKGGCGQRTANLTGTCTHCQKRLRELLEFLGKRVGDLTKTLNDFKKGVGTEDWALSMGRSHGAFEAAARHSLFTQTIGALTAENSKVTLESLRKHATNEVLRLASYPRHSSSLTANIMHGETLAAWVELLDHIKMRS